MSDEAPPGPDRSGELVAGKYRLNLRLGSGGMAEVWSATNRFTEREVAIKLLARDIAGAPDATARFLNEAKVSARVGHPNIVEVLDVGQAEDGQLFLVMELLTGYTLETALRRQTPPMTTHELAAVMLEVASALEAAHAAGIVHRDLKPTNVFLHKTKHGVRAKLLDFGVSKFRSEDEPSITIAGTVLGSPLYMSPEQARGETDVDGRSDVFAFGGLLFEALTGHRAYEAKNFNALIVKIATSRPKDIDAEAPHLPASLRAVVRACLEPDLTRRAPGLTEVLTLLRAALPDLAASPQALPSAMVPSSLFDPDATNALPVFTPHSPAASHEHAPAQAASAHAHDLARAASAHAHDLARAASAHVHDHARAASAHAHDLARAASADAGAPLFPEHTAYEAALSPREALRPSPWLPVVCGAIVIAGLAVYSQRAPAPPVVVSAPTTTPAPAPAQVAAATRLEVAASPGSCAISVDGVARGTTPVTLDDLSAGEHALECRPPSGPARAATVTLEASRTLRYRFLFP
ncbi:MAG: serine/threonine protein kinase [Labilithrix sp.]|nr:serine/threonine protein kinase [Labilithrix sp.]MCW5813827.1 serine/threonine protein kinase [Labilithrix sp.]